MKNTEIFTCKAELYSKYRTGYPDEFVRCLYSDVGINANSCVADIGSGTGMFSKLLLERGCIVYGIEPNDSMRMIAERELANYPSFHSINATGENSLLPESSIDFITVAQSFHWLDAELFKTECRRILKQNGKVVVIYNRKNKSAEINIKTAELMKKFYPEYKDIINHWEIREHVIKNFFDNKYEFVEFKHDIVNNLEEFIGRTQSASFSKNEEIVLRELENFFYCFSQENIIRVPNDTIAYIGTI